MKQNEVRRASKQSLQKILPRELMPWVVSVGFSNVTLCR